MAFTSELHRPPHNYARNYDRHTTPSTASPKSWDDDPPRNDDPSRRNDDAPPLNSDLAEQNSVTFHPSVSAEDTKSSAVSHEKHSRLHAASPFSKGFWTKKSTSPTEANPDNNSSNSKPRKVWKLKAAGSSTEAKSPSTKGGNTSPNSEPRKVWKLKLAGSSTKAKSPSTKGDNTSPKSEPRKVWKLKLAGSSTKAKAKSPATPPEQVEPPPATAPAVEPRAAEEIDSPDEDCDSLSAEPCEESDVENASPAWSAAVTPSVSDSATPPSTGTSRHAPSSQWSFPAVTPSTSGSATPPSTGTSRHAASETPPFSPPTSKTDQAKTSPSASPSRNNASTQTKHSLCELPSRDRASFHTNRLSECPSWNGASQTNLSECPSWNRASFQTNSLSECPSWNRPSQTKNNFSECPSGNRVSSQTKTYPPESPSQNTAYETKMNLYEPHSRKKDSSQTKNNLSEPPLSKKNSSQTKNNLSEPPLQKKDSSQTKNNLSECPSWNRASFQTNNLSECPSWNKATPINNPFECPSGTRASSQTKTYPPESPSQNTASETKANLSESPSQNDPTDRPRVNCMRPGCYSSSSCRYRRCIRLASPKPPCPRFTPASTPINCKASAAQQENEAPLASSPGDTNVAKQSCSSSISSSHQLNNHPFITRNATGHVSSSTDEIPHSSFTNVSPHCSPKRAIAPSDSYTENAPSACQPSKHINSRVMPTRISGCRIICPCSRHCCSRAISPSNNCSGAASPKTMCQHAIPSRNNYRDTFRAQSQNTCHSLACCRHYSCQRPCSPRNNC
ncbi:uncharacterized protein [Ambystoma mexicanum]|uniref:uncharacterized protein isoform X1 n=1 Tax=Ambystoma mexicanum TaxID=8296 RepID=UPI0037E996DC